MEMIKKAYSPGQDTPEENLVPLLVECEYLAARARLKNLNHAATLIGAAALAIQDHLNIQRK